VTTGSARGDAVTGGFDPAPIQRTRYTIITRSPSWFCPAQLRPWAAANGATSARRSGVIARANGRAGLGEEREVDALDPAGISPWHVGFRVVPMTGTSDRPSKVSAAQQSRHHSSGR
jgi:hypothetical protein